MDDFLFQSKILDNEKARWEDIKINQSLFLIKFDILLSSFSEVSFLYRHSLILHHKFFHLLYHIWRANCDGSSLVQINWWNL